MGKGKSTSRLFYLARMKPRLSFYEYCSENLICVDSALS